MADKKFTPEELTEWSERIKKAKEMIDKLGDLVEISKDIRISEAQEMLRAVLGVAQELNAEVVRLNNPLGTKATKEDIDNSLLMFGKAYIYKGHLLNPFHMVTRYVAEIEWRRLTKRTNHPKLAWLEKQLGKAGIANRRNGRTIQAPVLEVDTTKFNEACVILDSVDDIADDDSIFTEDLQPSPEVEKMADMVALLKDIHDEADHIVGTDAPAPQEVAIKNAVSIKRLAKECLDKL